MPSGRTNDRRASANLFDDPLLVSSVLDVLAGLVIILDNQGRILFFNKSCQDLTGFLADDVVGQRVWDKLIPTEERELVEAIFADVKAGKNKSKPRHSWLTKSGERVRIEWSNVAVASTKAGFGYVIGTGVNVTRDEALHETLKEAEARFQALLDTVPGAILVFDDLGTVYFFSRRAEKLFAYQAYEVVGSNVAMLIPAFEHGDYSQFLQQAGESDKPNAIDVRKEVYGHRKDGSTVPVEVALAEYQDGRRRFVAHIQDISERRTAQRHVQDMQSRLRQGSRQSALEQMGSVLAHELNQPLTALTNYLDSFQRAAHRESSELSPQLKKFADSALDQAQRASDTISNLRLLFTGTKPDPIPEPIGTVIDEAVDLSRVSHDGESVALVTNIDSPQQAVPMVKTQVLEVLFNLLQNAYDALASQSEGRIDIRCTPRDDNMIEVSVSDTGPGIDPSIKDRLFEPLTTTKKSGKGLGLAVSRSIVEAHGGQIWTTSDGTGSIFHFTLPLSE